jgi:hypothetical protein
MSPGDGLSPVKNSQEAGTDQSKQGWRGKRGEKVLETPPEKMKNLLLHRVM